MKKSATAAAQQDDSLGEQDRISKIEAITKTKYCVYVKFPNEQEANLFRDKYNLPESYTSHDKVVLSNPDGARIPGKWIVRILVDEYPALKKLETTIFPELEEIPDETTKYSHLKPGYVRVGHFEYYCGIRMLSKEESKDFPFDVNELKAIVQTQHNVHKNVLILAKNILRLHEQKIGFGQETKRCNLADKKIQEQEQEQEQKQEQKQEQGKQDDVLTRVQKADIVEAARLIALGNRGKKIAMLNPANRVHVGGGAFLGANALEEIYFRCSSLVLAYSEHAREEGFKYTAYGDHARPNYVKQMEIAEAWYTPDIEFHRHPVANDYKEYSPEEIFKIGIIGSTAPNYRSEKEADEDPNNKKLMKDEIEALLLCAIENGVQIPILTAHGCGAFNNNPNNVAKYFGELLYGEKNYSRYFDEIHFVIWDDKNYNAFNDCFSKGRYMELKKQDQEKGLHSLLSSKGVFREGANTSEKDTPNEDIADKFGNK